MILIDSGIYINNCSGSSGIFLIVIGKCLVGNRMYMIIIIMMNCVFERCNDVVFFLDFIFDVIIE